ncbi:MAG: hypothetical protein ACRDPY_23550, partial [Streptosporangiaceae bacterium]
MSDMEETPGASEASESADAAEGHGTTTRRVIGTPLPAPRLLGGQGEGNVGAEAMPHGGGGVAVAEHDEEKLPVEADYPQHAKNAEKIVVFCFLLAFIAGCGFIAAYVGLGVHSVDKVFRSNLALGLSLSVALLALGLGALIWVRHLMPDAEVTEERHEMRSTDAERAAFEEYFEEG